MILFAAKRFRNPFSKHCTILYIIKIKPIRIVYFIDVWHTVVLKLVNFGIKKDFEISKLG